MKFAFISILREQFNQLYRFGYIVIPSDALVYSESQGIPDHLTCQHVIDALLKSSPFEYEEEYIVLQLRIGEGVSEKQGLFLVSIHEVMRVFPLSERAKQFFESRQDPRIKWQDPVFQSCLESSALKRLWISGERAVQQLWHYFNLPGNPQEVWQHKMLDQDEIRVGIESRLTGMKDNALLKKPYWCCVVAYDRYDAYPMDILGNFYDSGRLFGISVGNSNFESTSLYRFLEQIRLSNSNPRFEKIREDIESSESTKPFRDKTQFVEEFPASIIRAYLVTPLFLMLKDDLRKKEDLRQTLLFIEKDYVRSRLNDNEFKVLLTLLGYFFGYKKFYDFFYENPPLSIHSLSPNEHDEIVHIEPLDRQITDQELALVFEEPVTLSSKDEVSQDEPSANIISDGLLTGTGIPSALTDLPSTNQQRKRKTNESKQAFVPAAIPQELGPQLQEPTDQELKEQKPHPVTKVQFTTEAITDEPKSQQHEENSINIDSDKSQIHRVDEPSKSQVVNEKNSNKLVGKKEVKNQTNQNLNLFDNASLGYKHHQVLAWLAEQLKKNAYQEGMLLSEFTKQFGKGKNQQDAKKLLNEDDRFEIKNKSIVLTESGSPSINDGLQNSEPPTGASLA